MNRRQVLASLGVSAGACLGGAPLRAFARGIGAPASDTATAIFLNQVGYLPGQTKIATIRGAGPKPASLRLRAVKAGGVAFEAALGAPSTDALSGDEVRQADFSTFRVPGEYRLEVGDVQGPTVLLDDAVYAPTLRTVVRGYTGQRCGCHVDLGEGYQHPPCHLEGRYGASSGKAGPLPNAGGWHDAGDYGRYTVNSGITCGTLLWAWEMFPGALRSLDLGLPQTEPRSAAVDGFKTEGKMPDYLREVLWNLGWMLQMQDSDGGVFHKQTSEGFCGFIMPQDDSLVSEVIGTGAAPYKSTAATGDFAAVMAIAARCYGAFDAALASRFRAAAAKAWEWAIAHPEVPFRNPPGITTGEYGDPHVSDELAWASAELWRTTGEERYETAFLRTLHADAASWRIGGPSWGDVQSMACWTYAMAQRDGDRNVNAAIREATGTAAQRLAMQAQRNGFGNTMSADDYVWGSNGVACNQSLLLIVANSFAGRAETVTAALNNLHYVLGRNCFGVSWVTQVGQRPFLHPHHRPSVADGIVAPWPGLLSGGPNRRPADAVARKLPTQPPMRMWIDDDGAYSMNEIAINWNAPLVFLLAFANTLSKRI